MRILWIPHTAWHVPQRAHSFCRELSLRGHTVHVTDWQADFYRLSDYASVRYLKNFTYRRRVDGGIVVHGIPRLSPALYSRRLRALNRALLDWSVRTLVRALRIDVVVGSYLASPPIGVRVVFDAFDDNVAYWASSGLNPEVGAEIAQTEARYLDRADGVTVVSTVLIDRFRERGWTRPLTHLPNGIRLSSFGRADGAAVRARFGAGKPIVGLIGNHDKRHELEKVIQTAAERQDLTFLIAGRGAALGWAAALVRRRRLPNVSFVGPLPAEEVPHFCAALDVGLCPYQKSAGADAGSPLRLLAYSAAGVPVVSTDLEEVRRMAFPNVVLVPDGVAALAEGIERAVHLPRGRPEEIGRYDIHPLTDRLEGELRG